MRNWFGDEAEELPTDASLRALSPEAFAGSWIGDAGELVVAYTSEPGRHAREAERRLGIKHRMSAVVHRRAVSELERVVAEINRAREEWEARGAAISYLEVDTMHNVVDVTVERLTDEVRRAFADRYGEAVILSEGRVEAT